MSLVCWVPLIGNTDQQGLSSITMSGSPNSWVDGKLGKCAHFAGSTANVIYNNTTDFNFTDNFSYCCWLKQNFNSGAQYAFTVGRADAGGYGYGIAIASATQITTIFGTRRVAVACAANEWHHVAVTVGDGKVKSYVDGSLVNTSDVATVPTYSDGNGLGLGCFHYSGNIYPYYGDLQDFRIYDHALSPKEIEILSRGLVLHYPMTGGGRGSTNFIKNGSYAEGTTSWSNWGSPPTREIVEVNGKKYAHIKSNGTQYQGYSQNLGIPLQTSTRYTLTFRAFSPTNNNINIGFHWNNASSIVSQSWYSVALTTEPKLYTVAVTTGGTVDRFNIMIGSSQTSTIEVYWTDVKLELGSVSTSWIPYTSDTAYNSMGYNDNIEYDVSGYLHNATCINTSYSSDTARYPVSTVFNKTAYLDVSALTIDMTQVTFAVWFKIASAQTWSRIFDFGSAEGGGYCFGLATGNNGTTLVVYGRRGSSGASLPDKTIQTISLNTWYHAVITLSGTTCKCYVNGTLIISYEITSAYPNSVAFALRYLGKSVFSADKLFDGNISDFRLYATALSAEDIQKLYNTAVSISNNGTLMAYELVEQ